MVHTAARCQPASPASAGQAAVANVGAASAGDGGWLSRRYAGQASWIFLVFDWCAFFFRGRLRVADAAAVNEWLALLVYSVFFFPFIRSKATATRQERNNPLHPLFDTPLSLSLFSSLYRYSCVVISLFLLSVFRSLFPVSQSSVFEIVCFVCLLLLLRSPLRCCGSSMAPGACHVQLHSTTSRVCEKWVRAERKRGN